MESKEKIKRIVRVFETGSIGGDYGCVSVYDDGRNPKTGKQDFWQITYGASQTTEQSHLASLLHEYILAGGQYAEEMGRFVPHINRSLGGGTYLSFNNQFKELLQKAGEDPVMQATQDAFFERVYFEPALYFANQEGFEHPLSIAVIYDSYIHSGKIRDDIRNMFPEKTPAFGGDEKKWIAAYVIARKAWLRSRKNDVLQKTVYRMDCFRAQIKNKNWDLSQPVIANGIEVV